MRLVWTLLFALAALFAIGPFVYAPFNANWWLPNSYYKFGSATDLVVSDQVISKAGEGIDFLFIVILWLTGIVFIGVQIVFLWSMWKFSDRPDRKTAYTHGSKKLELIWTIIPAFVLIWIAVYQLGAWADVKYRTHAPDVPPIAEVVGRQFQWVTRYPGDDKKLNTSDDIFTVNDFHFYTEPDGDKKDANGEQVYRHVDTMIHLKAQDVLHSFYLPQLRVKQDAVPGLTIPVWFNANKPGHYELVCAELCGWGHYKMRSKVTIHPSRADFEKWLAERKQEQLYDGVSQAKPASSAAPSPSPSGNETPVPGAPPATPPSAPASPKGDK